MLSSNEKLRDKNFMIQKVVAHVIRAHLATMIKLV
jgi:hypothetical protein